jgi:hypothetical protein
MNQDRWNQIYNEECNKVYSSYSVINPETWEDIKEKTLKFIDEIDKATEVYLLENSKENQNGRT